MKSPGRVQLLLIYFTCFCGSHIAKAQIDSLKLNLWKNGAPGFEKRKDEAEKGDRYISNIHNPSITVYFPPKEKRNGAALVICPGGGHRMLVMNSEGREPAKYLNSLGFVAIVLKYRLARDTNSPYQIEVHARQDGERAMRLARSHATEWGFDPARLGMMGFSAGGEVLDMVAFEKIKKLEKSVDPVDQLDCTPNFAVFVYPGPLGVPTEIEKDAPPAFLVAANDDLCCSPPIVRLLSLYREAGVAVEAHVFQQGKHGFNMGYRSKLKSIHSWPDRLSDWFSDNAFFKKTN